LFKPLNRHLWLQPVVNKTSPEEEPSTTILVPDDYKVQTSPYQPYEVLGKAGDCSVDVTIGSVVIVDSTMINKIELNGQEHYLLLENYVFATFEET
tara:strand:+ start:1449 stop:1736 length:288 start_codon:yes stop_codon:yes gene_type:complete